MPYIKELLMEELRDLFSTEIQLTAALPKMTKAAKHPKLKAAFERHLRQAQEQVLRLKQVFDLLGEKPICKECQPMQGLIKEGEQTIREGLEKDPAAADAALIAAAQKIEHYEIASYETVRALARQIGAMHCAWLLSYSLREEDGADFHVDGHRRPLAPTGQYGASGKRRWPRYAWQRYSGNIWPEPAGKVA